MSCSNSKATALSTQKKWIIFLHESIVCMHGSPAVSSFTPLPSRRFLSVIGRRVRSMSWAWFYRLTRATMSRLSTHEIGLAYCITKNIWHTYRFSMLNQLYSQCTREMNNYSAREHRTHAWLNCKEITLSHAVAYLGGACGHAPPRKVRKHFLTRYTVKNWISNLYILLKSALKMQEMPFQRPKFQKL